MSILLSRHLKTKLKLIIAMMTLIPQFAIGATFYFLEKDGGTSLIYKATCVDNSCSLESISLSTKDSIMKCRLHYYSLFQDEKATKSGESWIITSTTGGCGYTNSYTISKSGMVQIKTSSPKPKESFCEAFAPKVYKMEPTNKSNGIPVTGCSEIYPLGF